MHKKCPVCGQDFIIEPGFYFGAAYVSYAINVAILITITVLNIFVIKLSISTALWTFIPLILLATPPIYRLSRSIWIHIFVKKEE
ncbi:MAG: DUF983 domain-containing protein [Bacteroidota bacterium]